MLSRVIVPTDGAGADNEKEVPMVPGSLIGIAVCILIAVAILAVWRHFSLYRWTRKLFAVKASQLRDGGSHEGITGSHYANPPQFASNRGKRERRR